MSQKPHERFMMSFSEAARVLGISKRTFENGFKKGLYAEIHVEKHLGGWQANLLDVFHYAYPDKSHIHRGNYCQIDIPVPGGSG